MGSSTSAVRMDHNNNNNNDEEKSSVHDDESDDNDSRYGHLGVRMECDDLNDDGDSDDEEDNVNKGRGRGLDFLKEAYHGILASEAQGLGLNRPYRPAPAVIGATTRQKRKTGGGCVSRDEGKLVAFPSLPPPQHCGGDECNHRNWSNTQRFAWKKKPRSCEASNVPDSSMEISTMVALPRVQRHGAVEQAIHAPRWNGGSWLPME